MPFSIRTTIKAAVAMLAVGACVPCLAQSAEEIAKIQAAAPAKASAKAAKPRRVLVFNLTKGFKHSSIPFIDKAIAIVGQKTGAFETTCSQDMAVFEKSALSQFDAVVMNNTTGDLFTTPALRENLMAYVKGGGGLAGIHAATDCCYGWPEYGEMMGGYFDGHPWTANCTVTVKMDEPGHPVLSAFAGQDFEVKDEIYQFKAPYSRQALRVIASINTAKTDMNRKGIKRLDNDFAIAWVRPYGKGRVFYTSLGHNHDLLWNAKILRHYLDGIQFALGDLKAEAAPVKNAAGRILQEQVKHVLGALGADDYDSSRARQIALEGLIHAAAAEEATRKACARQLAAFLTEDAHPGSTLAAKQFVAQKLSEIGQEEEARVVAKLLRDPDARIADAGRLALERIPGKSIDAALRSALASAHGDARTGIVNSLGVRRDQAAVKPLMRVLAALRDERISAAAKIDALGAGGAKQVQDMRSYLERKELQQASAVLTALGRIANGEAASKLAGIISDRRSIYRPLAASAYLDYAKAMEEAGNNPAAVKIYKQLCAEEAPQNTRVAAWYGMTRLDGEAGIAKAVAALSGDDSPLHGAATSVLLESREGNVGRELLNRVSQPCTTETQAAMIRIFAARNESSGLAAIQQLADSADAQIRIEALTALAIVGNASTVEFLARKTCEGAEAERDIARMSLQQLADPKANAQLIALLESSPDKNNRAAAKLKSEAIKALVARRAGACVPALLRAAETGEKPVKGEAFKGLAELGAPVHLPAIVSLLALQKSEELCEKAEEAAASVARRIPEEHKRADEALAKLSQTTDAEASASLIRLLGKIGNGKAFETLCAARQEQQGEVVQDALVRALSDFPSARALKECLAIAGETSNKTHKMLSLRGVSRMLALESDWGASETLALCRKALDLAATSEQKKAVLGGLAEVKQPEVLELVQSCIGQEDVRSEAMAALLKIAESARIYSPRLARAGLRLVAEKSSEPLQREQAQKLLDEPQQWQGVIRGWQVSGPYLVDGAQTEDPLDVAFAPEGGAGTLAAWKLIEADAKAKGQVLLGDRMPGDRRVAYLRVRIWSPRECKVRLELGSDDGIVAWLNGSEIHRKCVSRSCVAGDDKVDVTLRKEWNHLMLKVSQHKDSWAAAARIVAVAGEDLKDVEPDTTCIDRD